MREGWRITTISEVCDIINGGTPKTNVSQNWGGNHLWITPAEMGRRNDPYIGDTARKITDLGLGDCSARLLPPLSVILSSRAPIGHLVINTAPMATNQGCKGLVPSNSLDHKFLFYYLTSVVELLNELGTGTTFKELSGGKLKEVPIALPPLPEQARIVTILDEAFAGISTAVANIERNLANARELFDSYLQSALCAPDKAWTEKKLSDVCERITDGTHQTPTYYDRGIVFLSSRNVASGKIDWENVKYIDEKQHLEMHRRVAPRPNDILLAKNGTTGVAAIVDRDVVFDIYVSLALLRAKEGLNPRFLLYFVNSPIAKEQFNKRLKGIGVPNLHLEEIRDVVVSFPRSVQEQVSIVSRLDNIAAEVGRIEAICQKKLNCLVELKQSILRKAFAGELTALPEQALQEAAD